MNRRLFKLCIEAIKINDDTIRVSTDSDSSSAMWGNVMQKEWDFLEDILKSFTGKENTVDAILRIASEYKGYGK